ncbi:MAG: hypothetical protein MUC88_20875 [Planctomycetes bacterium]|nr:hypothetical protein [Planctomycetota bacterium]
MSEDRCLCREAADYYYDLLSQDRAAVPPHVVDHVEACLLCQEQIGRLRDVLREAERHPDPGERGGTEMVAALTRQFRLLDENVMCADVKPFLPELLLAVPSIRIPTPVTVHVDHCPPCAQDLATLGGMALRAEQLQRLGQVLRAVPNCDAKACRRAHATVAALGDLSLDTEDARSREHVSTCPRCRAEVYRRRERCRGNVGEGRTDPAAVVCRNVGAAEIFDYVVPYGLPPGPRPSALATHLRGCPMCRAKVQVLHRLIYGIVQRPDSETTTLYQMENVTPESESRPPEVTYRYPVSVQVLQGEPNPTAEPAPEPVLQPAWMRVLRGPAGSVGRAAAVVVTGLLLIGLLWPSAPTASGTSVGDVLRVLAKAENVHIARIRYHETEPFEELWIARRAGVFVRKLPWEYKLSDLNRHRNIFIDRQTGTTRTAQMDRNECNNARQFITDSLADALAAVAPGTKLHAARDDSAGEILQEVDVYEVPVRRDKDPRAPVLRAYIDRRTGLPRRTEYFQHHPSSHERRLQMTTVFTYLSEPDMNDAIRAMFPTP